ncbi:GNAT family N-acetyltransferase [Pontibacter sp. KCTC 32443]|uniref:GNAT family N-acetyltransferase n=1 Tax=Pontibacter TaxID=323449 RepID=UPI00164D71FF|nr:MULTISPECIES: GNAT family N-acetyltransferase [Pontibacter]MBC5774474.1 GNAT family N-acetyltransferase [Pontibacter sp. KCTC 32443]
MEVIKYSDKYKTAWDAFVTTSKNGTFLLYRDYLKYHANRFIDHSLLFYSKGKLIALLPANVVGREVQSHGGLSYGGIVSGASMKAQLMLEVFDAMVLYFREQGFESITYKTIPYIYHQLPSGEDLYALFRHKAILYRRDLNTVIQLGNKLPYAKLRQRKIKQQKNIVLGQSSDFDQFIGMMGELLQLKYNTLPAHTATEVELLAKRFPDNIKLHTATQGETILAGILIYETATVAHCQYIGATTEGLAIGALDALTDFLITHIYSYKAYFSFGISTEQQGKYLNKHLIQNKESYGGRAVVHDFYQINL